MNLKIKANPVFKEPDRSDRRYIVMKGSAGSGKSVDTAQHYILRMMSDPGRNLIAMRKSDVTNRQSTFAELTGAIFRIFGAEWEKYWVINSSIMTITFKPNGNQIIFRGMNDDKQREKLKSVTFPQGNLTDIWLEEATEFSQNDLEIIDDRLRGELPPGQFYQIRLTFNPVSATHWIKKVFFDREDPDVSTHHSTYRDNRFIDQAYYRRMERRKEVDPEGYEVYGLGNWGQTSGLILRNWETKEVSQSLEDYDDLAIGHDFGFNHADATLLLGMKDGDIYVLKEIYIREKDTAEIIQIAEAEGIPKEIPMYCDSAEPDRIKMWKKAGYKAMPVKKMSGTNAKYQATQIDWLKGEVKSGEVFSRKIYVDPSCVNTIKELQQWRWKKDTGSGEYLDEPVAFMDDAMAALRYGVEGWRKVRPKIHRVYGGL